MVFCSNYNKIKPNHSKSIVLARFVWVFSLSLATLRPLVYAETTTDFLSKFDTFEEDRKRLDEYDAEFGIQENNFSELLSNKSIGLLNSLSQSGKFNNELKKYLSPQITDQQYIRSHSGLLEKKASKTQSQQLKDSINKTSQEVLAMEFVSESALYKNLKRGLQFDLSFSNLFNTSSAPSNATPKVAHNIKYGLILAGVEGKKDFSHAQAFIGNDMDEHLISAQRADLQWRIDKIKNNGDKKAFALQTIEPLNSTRPFLAHPQQNRSWLPSPDFKTSINAADSNKLTEALKNKQLPQLLIKMTQVEDLYSMNYYTKTAHDEVRIEHDFNIPLYRSLRLLRTYDKDFKEIETGLSGLLIREDAPSLGIKYLHTVEQYQSLLNVKIDPKTNLSLALQDDAKKITGARDSKAHDKTYSVALTKEL